MSVATTTAIGIAAGVGAIGSVATGVIGANAAGNASNAQVGAANQAANLQHQDAQAALDFNKQQWQTQQNNLAPWLQTGTAAQANLANLMGVLPANATLPGTPGTPGSTVRVKSSSLEPGGDNPGFQMDTALNNGDGLPAAYSGLATRGGSTYTDQFLPGTPGTPGAPLSSLVNPSLGATGSLAQGWQGGAFKAPDNVTEQNDPGYQFRLAQGQKAIEQSAAARGGLLSGGTAKALDDYSQGSASNEYGNVYNRALGEYQQSYNQFQQGATDKYNRLANLAGQGQITAQQLGQLGNQAAGNNTNILLTSGQQIGQDLNNAGAARASGYVGGANAYSGALGGVANAASQYGLLNMLTGSGATAPAAATSGWGVV